MNRNTVLVTGASGRTGGAIVSALVRRNASVRGLVRRPELADHVRALGAEVFMGDFEQTDRLIAAAEGCDVVIHIGPPMHAREVDYTQSMLDAARSAGVSQFIYYSVMQPLRLEVVHHAAKLAGEERVVESDLPYTILQPARYMQNLEPHWREVVDEGVHAMPFDVDAKFNLVELYDLAEAAAIVATQPGHLYATYELAGAEALSQTDMAKIIAERLGRPVAASKLSNAEMSDRLAQRGVPAERIEKVAIMNSHYDRHGFRGNPNILRWLLGREPRSFASYVDSLAARA